MRTALAALGWVLSRASGFMLMMVVMIEVFNMITRVFGHPVPGTYEITGWLMSISLALALGYAQIHLAHVNIDSLIKLFPSRARLSIELCILLLSTGMFGVAAWQLFSYGSSLQTTGSRSETLTAPVYPWVYAVAASVIILAFVLVVQSLQHVHRLFFGASGYIDRRDDDKGST